MGYQDVTFPSGTKILITGVAGFIGSHLAEALLKKDVTVLGIDDLSNGKLSNMDTFLSHPNFTFAEGDIRDFDFCLKVTKNVDYVLHQAAWGSVPRSIEMPRLYEEINVGGTLNIFEASKQNKVKRVVYASSSSVYGDSEKLPKVEGQEGNVLSPYALTKKVNEEHGRLYHKLYGLETIGLRYFNVFGLRQDPNGPYAAVIPKFIKLLKEGIAPTIYGDGLQSRDFTYIENVIEANLKALIFTKATSDNVFNVAYGGQETLINVFNKMQEALEISLKPRFTMERPGDIKHSNADISKAISRLSYNPEYDFELGFKDYLNALN